MKEIEYWAAHIEKDKSDFIYKSMGLIDESNKSRFIIKVLISKAEEILGEKFIEKKMDYFQPKKEKDSL